LHAQDRVEYAKCEDRAQGVGFSIYSVLSSGNENRGFIDFHSPGLNLQETPISGLDANPIWALRRNLDYVVQVAAKSAAVRIAFPDPYVARLKSADDAARHKVTISTRSPSDPAFIKKFEMSCDFDLGRVVSVPVEGASHFAFFDISPVSVADLRQRIKESIDEAGRNQSCQDCGPGSNPQSGAYAEPAVAIRVSNGGYDEGTHLEVVPISEAYQRGYSSQQQSPAVAIRVSNGGYDEGTHLEVVPISEAYQRGYSSQQQSPAVAVRVSNGGYDEGTHLVVVPQK
jgi:hypothetical protein